MLAQVQLTVVAATVVQGLQGSQELQGSQVLGKEIRGSIARPPPRSPCSSPGNPAFPALGP